MEQLYRYRCSKVEHKEDFKIWILDDEKLFLKSFSRQLKIMGHEPCAFDDPHKLLLELGTGERNPDLIFLDVNLGMMNGPEVLKEIKKVKNIPVIMISGDDDAQVVVECMKHGAYNYLKKPFKENNLEAFIFDIQSLPMTNKKDDFSILFDSKSDKFLKVLEKIKNVGGKTVSVLIQGESGTGKEIVSKYIHSQWAFESTPYIDVNCPAIPEGLAESELFGHKKGSFTGASEDRVGKIELSNTGTLFLDEIADLSAGIQNKLLRVLQEREIQKIGDSEKIPVEFQLISATSKNLLKKDFREDLYYRVAEIVVTLPPLRERTEDISQLASNFISSFCRDNNLAIKELDESAIELLESYSWPGNIRELNSVIKRSVLLCSSKTLTKDDIQIDNLNIEVQKERKLSLVENSEKDLILKELEASGGNLSATARRLGVGRSTLYRKLKKYDIKKSA